MFFLVETLRCMFSYCPSAIKLSAAQLKVHGDRVSPPLRCGIAENHLVSEISEFHHLVFIQMYSLDVTIVKNCDKLWLPYCNYTQTLHVRTLR